MITALGQGGFGLGKVCAVIAEYDPFHNGHFHHLAETRKTSGASALVVFMTSYVSQRGAFTLFSPQDRAAMALQSGADIVFGLPCQVTCREAEWYAYHAIEMMNRSQCIDLISFGCENEREDLLRKAASILVTNPPAFESKVQELLSAKNNSYPKAVSHALEALLNLPEGFMNQPNVILAVSYLRALMKTGSRIQPILIHRKGAYHSTEIVPETPSASALRSVLRSGSHEEIAAKAVPCECWKIIREAMSDGRFFHDERGNAILLAKLSAASANDLLLYCPLGEGLEGRLLKAAPACKSREELLEKVCSPRITKARVSRILTAFQLGLTQSAKLQQPYLRLFGFRKQHSQLVKAISENVPCYQSFHQIEVNPACACECRAAKLWHIGAGLDYGRLYKEKAVVI